MGLIDFLRRHRPAPNGRHAFWSGVVALGATALAAVYWANGDVRGALVPTILAVAMAFNAIGSLPRRH